MKFAEARAIIEGAGYGSLPQRRRYPFLYRLVAGEPPDVVLAALRESEERLATEAAARERAAELARELCLTPDGKNCRPDVWKRLLKLVFAGGGATPCISDWFAREFIPAEHQGVPYIVDAMRRELGEWADCAADSVFCSGLD